MPPNFHVHYDKRILEIALLQTLGTSGATRL